MFNMFGYHFYEMEFHHYAPCVEHPIIWNLLIYKANGTNTNHIYSFFFFSLSFHFNCSRMFPSLRVALSGLEKDAHYCVVLEMAPLSDCRYKFSGSQWIPAGGAEPQSAQRMYIHPDSPALGSHWQAQPVIFNKVKLTNNTLDSNGHVSIFYRFISSF